MNEKKYPLVCDSRDPRFLTLRSLQTHSGRTRTGHYIIEGIRHLARAIEHRAPIDSVFLDPSILSNPFGQRLARQLRKQGVPGIRLSHRLYCDLTLANEPQGIGAVLRQRWFPLEQVRAERHSLWLAVESIESPGNLGTIIRTAEAAGVTGVVMLSPNCDPCDPATVRATMGSLFSQKLMRCSPHEFIDWARSNGITLIASSPTGLIDYKALAYRLPAVLIVGSEKHGLSEQLLEAANFVVRIPMRGGCDSLNAAVAAGVVLFEMAGQREERPGTLSRRRVSRLNS
jgi:TrmH family RNA methyltransferase